ncbi:hypothetical protein BH24ACT7_BH24ACT7_25290 [soil metagenome]
MGIRAQAVNMRICFLTVRRVPPVESPLLIEVYRILESGGFEVESSIAEERVTRPDLLRPEHDLYVLKSHTELSLSLAGILHGEGALILSPYPACATAQNKIITSRRLRAAGVPIPDCWVTGRPAQMGRAAQERPLILKPYLGHRGEGIMRAESPDDLLAMPEPGSPLLIQHYVLGPGEDLKVYVVGEEVFAVRKPFSGDSFTRAGRPCPVSDEVRRIALDAGRALGLGLYGLDVVEAPAGPVVVDVNYFPGYKGVAGAAPLVAAYIEAYARGEVDLSAHPRETVI